MPERLARFDEIEVKRIRIVDDRGVMRLSLSGKPLDSGMFRGQTMIEQGRPQAGFLFFTEEATECGGLVFSGKSTAGRVDALGGLTMDAYEQDQVVSLGLNPLGNRFALAERPFTPISELVRRLKGFRKWLFVISYVLNPRLRRRFKESAAPRLLIGRQGKDAGVFMYDRKGRARIRMVVDGVDVPRMEFLNEAGKVTDTLPPTGGSNGKV